MKKFVFLLFGFLFLHSSVALATHLRAGEIIAERISLLTYRITITVYTDTGSDVRFGEGFLNFGDNSDAFQLPVIENNTHLTINPDGSQTIEPLDASDLAAEVAVAQFTIIHTYSFSGLYLISYGEPNRNEGILNVDGSVDTPFFVETEILIDTFIANSTPQLLIPPIDGACTGVAFFHNPGAFDPDGDSISFELVTPQRDVGTDVINYRDPNSREFYTNFEVGDETGSRQPTFSINPVTGDLVWNAPGDLGAGEYIIAFTITEWRKVNGQFFRLGFVTRDMQIIVEDCNNERPELIIPEDICVEAGTLIEEAIFGTDPDGDDVIIEAFSQVFDLVSNSATVTPSKDDQPQPTLPTPAQLDFSWQTDCSHVRDQPYQVVFKITDSPPMGPKLVSFATWNITVIGPAPEFVNPNEEPPAGREITLEWNPYECSAFGQANEMQIWRRVDSFMYMPDSCETGIREGAGYELIDEVDINVTTYVDDNNGQGLAFGARYCYRLVALFPNNGATESVVSEEKCFSPIEAEAPVITKVSIIETDDTDGTIDLEWTSPFEIDRTAFPGPYRYQVYRALGFNGDAGLTFVGETVDTTLTDVGLNTLNNIYNYRIVFTDPNNTIGLAPDEPIDTSAMASSVRLEPTPSFEEILLSWSADVPWSNNIQDFPLHDVFRDNVDDGNPDSLILIATVNVNVDGFNYVDDGTHNDTPLEPDIVYCYRVQTRGSYGNDLLPEPLENFSQVICAQPSDTIPPCTPDLNLAITSCEEFIAQRSCNFNDFFNELTWRRDDDPECANDIASFNIYFARTTEEEFSLLANVRDTFFVHDNLTSFAGCYAIRAVDRSGNESDFSETICNDNCPFYELPNVFTPNGDECNDLFRAFTDDEVIGEGGEATGGCRSTDPTKCARFVRSVVFTVYNRWGKEVYTNQNDPERSILINWDGRSNDGTELSTGVYYYLAEVEFDVVNPAESVQQIKGWIQLLR
ncbi:MAG: gliding motility-associated C-terminal domain-containing protein [Bacteroidota bacterium]